VDVAAHGHEAAEHAAEGDQKANDDRHVKAPHFPSDQSVKRFFLA
jgi:hypothetical protein